jgi:hypothetical protein
MNDPLAYDPEDAYYGVLGEIATRHRDQIPLNLVAFYAMLLPAIGSLIGRRAVITVSRDCHYANLFTAIVCGTGKGKGTCWNIIEHLLKEIDPDSPKRFHRDAASAQGLIGLVRDASTRMERGKEVKDEGVPDKRCLLIFEEMDTLFVSMNRQGSTLAPVWNMAYDGKTLENNTRQGREKATDPHVSAVCQITEASFEKAVGVVSKGLGVSNGLFNRFITVRAQRDPSRKLPRGGEMPDVSDLAEKIRDCLDSLGTTNDAMTVSWHPSTYAAWDAFVDAVDGDHPFLAGLGGVEARLKPNTMRVAMIFAVMDGAQEIMPGHLNAAKSFCLQCIDSSRDLFGSSYKHGRPDRLRERVLEAMECQPKTLTQFHACLHRKGYTSSSLRQVLAELTAGGLSLETTMRTEHGKTVSAWSAPSEAPVLETQDPSSSLQRLDRGACVVVTQDTHATASDGSSEYLTQGQTLYLGSIPRNATTDERRTIHSIKDLYPGQVCAWSGGKPVFVERAAIQPAASVTSA